MARNGTWTGSPRKGCLRFICSDDRKPTGGVFDNLETQTLYGSFRFLKQETEQKILDTLDRLVAAIAEAVGSNTTSFVDAIQLMKPKIQEYGNKTLTTLLLEWTGKLLPAWDDDLPLMPEDVVAHVESIDTREKLEAVLRQMPEPDPEKLDATLLVLRRILPAVRQVLLPFAKRLPHPPGGRPRKLADRAKRQSLRDEIGLLLASGVELRVAEKRLADREGVGVTTIRTIWYENKRKRKKRSQ
jgi:hypothetical protein